MSGEDDLERLEDMVECTDNKLEPENDPQITILKRYLHNVEKQIDELRSSDLEHWEEKGLTSNLQHVTTNLKIRGAG